MHCTVLEIANQTGSIRQMTTENPFDLHASIAESGARLVLSTPGVVLIADKPVYVFSGGSPSNVYINAKEIPMHPKERKETVGFLTGKVLTYGKIDVVAGVPTAGVGWAWGISDNLGLPYTTARTEPKDHGTKQQQDAPIPTGSKVLLVEDVINSGDSSMKAGNGVRVAGSNVERILAVINYNLPSTFERAKKEGYKLDAVTNIPTILRVAKNEELLDKAKLQKFNEWYEKMLATSS